MQKLLPDKAEVFKDVTWGFEQFFRFSNNAYSKRWFS